MSNEPAASPTALFVDVQGLNLRLWRHRSKSDQVKPYRVLFLHGYYDTGRSFDDLISHLDPQIEAWCLDFRGHGQSNPAPSGASYHLLDHVKDTFCTLEHLAKQSTPIDLLVGHSMGGNIALMVAGAVPEHVPGLILLDTIGAPSEDPAEQPARLGQALGAMLKKHDPHFVSSVGDAIEKLKSNNPQLTTQGASRMAAHMLHRDDQDRLSFAFDPRLRGPAPHRYPENTWRSFCARVKGPVTILRAENGYTPPDGEYMDRLKAFRRANLIVVKGVGHHLHVDAPQEVADQVNQYAMENLHGR